MNKVALDTNVLMCLFDPNNPAKTKIADDLLIAKPFLPVQVVSEFLNVSKRLLKLPKLEIIKRCRQAIITCNLIPTTHFTLQKARPLLSDTIFNYLMLL